ncbi:MAG: hypothetical protein AAGB34_00255 [Planctomycetota bacterium]
MGKLWDLFLLSCGINPKPKPGEYSGDKWAEARKRAAEEAAREAAETSSDQDEPHKLTE